MSAPLTAITMPKWGLTMTEGKVVQWLHQPGTSFVPGDELLEIETSKITNVVEAEAPGTLLRVVAAEGATLPIGGLLAVIGPADAPAADIDTFVSGFVVAAPAEDSAEAEAAPAPRMLDVAGTRLRYLELGSGDGTPVLLLHGFGADLNSWMFNQPALADQRRVVALDLPGHGGSARDVGAGDATALKHTLAAFADALDAGPLHVVGHSLGGALAALLAENRPDLVCSLSLIAPAGLGPEINAAFIDGFVRASRRKDAVEVLQLLVHDPALVSRTMVEDVLRFKRLDGVATALAAIAQAWFAGSRQRVSIGAALNGLEMPMQVIWGREDRIIPATHVQAVPARAAVHVLDAAGHLPHMEKAGEVNRLIRQFTVDSLRDSP
ncbi:MAG TPA: acetoin dehydrogenase dihydrolipoyllysine-residue acetyltransferase subunit [Acetobacteraceae bacterium]|nr:acetoin dehydrogenase dihydrolipoyllysine-residue acetyltransferase subunit [Acetobacteraceae bacterium]